MKIFFLFCLLCGVLGPALAIVSFEPLEEKPEHLKHMEGCYIEAMQSVMPTSTVMQVPGECKQYHCEETHFVVETCPKTMDSADHKLVEDMSLPYPDCCPRMVIDKKRQEF